MVASDAHLVASLVQGKVYCLFLLRIANFLVLGTLFMGLN